MRQASKNKGGEQTCLEITNLFIRTLWKSFNLSNWPNCFLISLVEGWGQTEVFIRTKGQPIWTDPSLFELFLLVRNRAKTLFLRQKWKYSLDPNFWRRVKLLKFSTEARFGAFWVAKSPFSKPLLHRRLNGGVNFSESTNRIEASWPPQKQPETSFCFEKACFLKGYWRKRYKSCQRGNLQKFVST